MNRATRATASILGIYAGLLGMVHGINEVLQGNVAPGGIMISAIGPPCQADTVWHACLPAMTLVPSFLVTGALSVLLSLITLVWAAAFVQRKRGGPILVLLAMMMVPVGGGFVPAFIGIIAGIAGAKINLLKTI